MRIKEVEALVGITKKNIRFYEKEGLLSPGRESENSYRDYDEEDLHRLRTIKLLRKLNMPISEIRNVLEDCISLSVAAKRHAVVLEAQQNNIEKARLVCEMISDENVTLAELDAQEFLARMESMEREGAIFMNIRKNDVRQKYVGPVVSCVVLIALFAALALLLIHMNRIDPAPAGLVWVFMGFFVIAAIGTVIALVSRIKEIRGGEENDLGNY